MTTIEPARRGRPPKSAPLPPPEPAKMGPPEPGGGAQVPSFACAHCGKYGHHRVIRTRPEGTAQRVDLSCVFCGRRMDYDPASHKVRRK